MAAKGWAYPDLVRHSGESRSVVSQWLGRSSKLIRTIGKMQAAERLEEASGYAALWIAKGAGQKMAPLKSTTPKLSLHAETLGALADRITDAAEKRCFQSIATHYAQLAIKGELSSTIAAGRKALIAPEPTLEPLPADALQSGSIRVTHI